MPFNILHTVDPHVAGRFEVNLVITGLDPSGNPNAVVGDVYELSINPTGIAFDNFELPITVVDSSNTAGINFVSPDGFPSSGTFTIEVNKKYHPMILVSATVDVVDAIPIPPPAPPVVLPPPTVIPPPPPVVLPPPPPPPTSTPVFDHISHILSLAIIAMLTGAAIMALLAILCLPIGVVVWIAKNGSSTTSTSTVTPPVVINTNGGSVTIPSNTPPPSPPTGNSGDGKMRSWPSPCKNNCP